MFFCPNCDNMYDIARSIPQSGKGRLDIKLSNESSESFLSIDSTKLSITDDIVDTDISVQSGGKKSDDSDNYGDLLSKILDETVTSTDFKNIDVDELLKSASYKKLKVRHKEFIYNKIQDMLPTNKKKITKNVIEKSEEELMAFFICNNCGYAKKIEPGTKIFSRTSEDISQNYAVADYKEMLNSKILPYTRKYICPNKKCESYNDPSKREAVFFRLNNSYKVKYLCTTCGTDF